jgi:hypothetical protein
MLFRLMCARQRIGCVGQIAFSGMVRLQPCPSRGEPRQPGPVGIAFALGDGVDEMIPHQARDRHRHDPGIGGGKGQSHILQSERHLEPVRGILLLGDDGAMGSIDRC